MMISLDPTLVGKTIRNIRLVPAPERENFTRAEGADEIRILLDDQEIVIWDDGQQCCEHRFLSTDDDLADQVGSTLMGIDFTHWGGELIDPDYIADYPVDFGWIRIHTDRGTVVFSAHNEHNGYYAGIHAVCEIRSLRD